MKLSNSFLATNFFSLFHAISSQSVPGGQQKQRSLTVDSNLSTLANELPYFSSTTSSSSSSASPSASSASQSYTNSTNTNLTPSQQSLLITSQAHKLVDANHILHYHKVLDAYGHVSIRHPIYPTEIFIMSRSLAPALVSGLDDLVQYYISNAEPVNPGCAPQGFEERHIHSSIYKRHPEVNAVVHSHSEAVLPFTITNLPFVATNHLTGFLGVQGAPVFEAEDYYLPGDVPNLLVTNERLGSALASLFDAAPDGNPVSVVLMRGHGMTVVAADIEEVTQRAVYTQNNANVQRQAVGLLKAPVLGPDYYGQNEKQPTGQKGLAANEGASRIRYLSAAEALASRDTASRTAVRPWMLWRREVDADDLYVNEVDVGGLEGTKGLN